MSRLQIVVGFLISVTIISCGGGGGSDTSNSLPEQLIISVSPAGDISGNRSVRNFSDCNGATWSECVQITASIRKIGSPRIDSFSWILDSARGNPNSCGAATVSDDGYTLTVPAYCSENGYECRFSANVQGRDSKTGFAVFDQYITWIDFGPLQCQQSTGVVFNGERLAQATIFIDSNYNFVLDDEETSVKSNFFGEFVLDDYPVPYNLVALGGEGIDSGTLYSGSLLVARVGVENGKELWVSPITTVHTFAKDPSKFEGWLQSQEIFVPDGDQPSVGYIVTSEKILERADQITMGNVALPIDHLNQQIASEILEGRLIVFDPQICTQCINY